MAGEKKCSPPSDKSEKSTTKNGKKPQLRGLHLKQTLRHVYVACGLSVLSGVLFYFFNNQKRIKAYEEFYKTYDANASFERMSKAGLLDSCPPEPPEKPKKSSGLLCF